MLAKYESHLALFQNQNETNLHVIIANFKLQFKLPSKVKNKKEQINIKTN